MNSIQHYLQHIAFCGDAAPDLITLKTLHQRHPATIPFENIDVLQGKEVSLNATVIHNKLVTERRGGYCFEHNKLMMWALQQIGFPVEPLMARVVWQQAPGAEAGPKSHLLLRVTLDGVRWLVDVGFGGLVLTAPLQFNLDLPQSTPHETFRVVSHSQGWMLQARINADWTPVYLVDPQPLQPVDIQMANWYTATHPQSKFRHQLMAARASEDSRYTLLNDRLTIRRKNQPAEKLTLTDGLQLRDVLAKYFLLSASTSWTNSLFQNGGFHLPTRDST